MKNLTVGLSINSFDEPIVEPASPDYTRQPLTHLWVVFGGFINEPVQSWFICDDTGVIVAHDNLDECPFRFAGPGTVLRLEFEGYSSTIP